MMYIGLLKMCCQVFELCNIDVIHIVYTLFNILEIPSQKVLFN